MISDFGVSVEAGPRVHIEFPISGIEYMRDVMSLESPFVFGNIPGLKNKVQLHTYTHLKTIPGSSYLRLNN